jgi:galactokinase
MANKVSSPSKAPLPQVYALVLVDASVRRRSEHRLYTQRCRELENARGKLKIFENEDAPAYSRWFQAEFAEQLQQLYAARAEIARLHELEAKVRWYARLKKMPLSHAYVEVKAAIEAGKSLIPEEDGSFPRDEMEGDECDPMHHNDDDDDEWWADEPPPRGTGSFRDDDYGAYRQESGSRGNSSPSDDYIKAIYRRLVRVLHPDSNREMTEAHKTLWHEVQTAYEDKNLSRLQQLMQKLEGDSPLVVDFATIPISHIMALRSEVEKQLRQVRRDLAEARKEPWWNFRSILVSAKRLRTMRHEVAAAIAADASMIHATQRRVERQLALWERQPPTPKKPPGKLPARKKPHAKVKRRGRNGYANWLFDE